MFRACSCSCPIGLPLTVGICAWAARVACRRRARSVAITIMDTVGAVVVDGAAVTRRAGAIYEYVWLSAATSTLGA